VLAWLVASLIALTPRAATACSCLSRGPACQAYWQTDAVFDATVLSITPRNPAEPLPGGQLQLADKIVKLDVRKSWKGVETGPLEITTRFVLDLRQGRVYTFMARDQQSGRLAVSGPRLEIGASAPQPVRIVIQREPPRR
jgi:hypothetical protein